MLTPLEVKKGMDSIASKDTYGDRLAFDGGLNAFYYEEPEKKVGGNATDNPYD
jgi:hypothetical protein